MATINQPVIEIKDLSFGYHGNPILDQVSCSIESNAFTVVMGKNGSGKSTLLRTIAGILNYEKGSIKINGTERNTIPYRERARRLGFLSQQHKPVFPFKVSEVVLTGRASYVQYTPKEKDREEAKKALEKTGILNLKDRIYSELSGGEQQLVMIARILAQQPDILLLDEPISHLDYNNQIRILKMLKQLVSENLTIVAVLHDPNMAFLFGDYFVLVHEQKLHRMKEGRPGEDPVLRKIFDYELQPVEHEGNVIFIPQVQ